MTYNNSKGQPHDKDVVGLIEKIRSGKPGDIAPEVYGLRKVLSKEPVTTVLKLMELDLPTLNTYDVEIDGKKVDHTPIKGETFGAWKGRTTWSEDFDSRAETAAYTSIGYDWVNWEWLPPGQSPLTAKKARYEIVDKTELVSKTKAEHDALYKKCLAVSSGNSGYSDEEKGIFKIRTFAPSVEKLKKDGYKNLQFNNGGDDDVLVVDTQRKEFAFFEDHAPTKLARDPKYSGGSLRSMYSERDIGR